MTPFENPRSARLMLAALLSMLSLAASAADARRQAEVAQRGAEVMPFSLAATTHVFTETADGGVQRVVAKRAGDAKQIALIREHLHAIRAEFAKGDFSAPAQIHGMHMPGLATLQAARPGQISIAYQVVPSGAELSYRSADAALVTAIHQWFGAQLADHGHDAMAASMHHGGGMSMDGMTMGAMPASK